MAESSDSKRTLLRHAVATLAYRGGKAVRGAPPEFASLKLGEKSRTPLQVLAHIGDLLEWARHLADGEKIWHDTSPDSWGDEVERFYRGLARLDERLATDVPLGFSEEKLFQGPIADALQHVGQITMMRRLGGSPIKGENYFRAEIAVGHVGPDQQAPRREFE